VPCILYLIFITMYVKIYFNDKPLFLCDAIDKIIQPFIHHDDAVYVDELNAHTIKTMIHEMQEPKVHAGIFQHPDLQELKKAFFKKFSLIQAAGGLVKNDEDKILLIFRRGRWDLPKGKLDKGEKLEDCAIREVEEETGLKNVKLNSPLIVTYHTYHEGTKFILKESHWFTMTIAGGQKLIPQTEEDIVDIKWIRPGEVSSYFSKSFPLIADVIRSAKERGFTSL
jgi:8-oxo-dGTP pyrophosphatase MutT (NUDIX family)